MHSNLCKVNMNYRSANIVSSCYQLMLRWYTSGSYSFICCWIANIDTLFEKSMLIKAWVLCIYKYILQAHNRLYVCWNINSSMILWLVSLPGKLAAVTSVVQISAEHDCTLAVWVAELAVVALYHDSRLAFRGPSIPCSYTIISIHQYIFCLFSHCWLLSFVLELFEFLLLLMKFDNRYELLKAGALVQRIRITVNTFLTMIIASIIQCL